MLLAQETAAALNGVCSQVLLVLVLVDIFGLPVRSLG